MVIPCYTRLPEKEAGRARQASFAGEAFTIKQNGAVELCLSGLLAGSVAAIPDLTRAGLARYNSF